MTEIDPCPKCGCADIVGPTPCRRKTGRTGHKYQRQMRFNCRGCDHVYQFDVCGRSEQARTNEAVARWSAARPAQMKPTQRLAAELGLMD